jgi:hypothetical protein
LLWFMQNEQTALCYGSFIQNHIFCSCFSLLGHNTVKSAISSTSGTKRLLKITIFQNIILSTYLSVPSNLMDRPNHLTCHLISCPVFHAALSSHFHHYLRNKGLLHLHNITQQAAPYLT